MTYPGTIMLMGKDRKHIKICIHVTNAQIKSKKKKEHKFNRQAISKSITSASQRHEQMNTNSMDKQRIIKRITQCHPCDYPKPILF